MQMGMPMAAISFCPCQTQKFLEWLSERLCQRLPSHHHVDDLEPSVCCFIELTQGHLALALPRLPSMRLHQH